jgi:hypothetical protein
VELLRPRQFLIQDLLCGRVDDGHPLAAYLRRHGFDDDDLAWSAANPAVPYYPHLTTTEYRTRSAPCTAGRRRWSIASASGRRRTDSPGLRDAPLAQQVVADGGVGGLW